MKPITTAVMRIMHMNLYPLIDVDATIDVAEAEVSIDITEAEVAINMRSRCDIWYKKSM